jgi:hypothetical protein
MIILIDTEDKTIEIEGTVSAKETKKNLKLVLKEFDQYNYIIFDPITIKFIPLDLTDTFNNLLNYNNNIGNIIKQKDIKPGPPKQ